MRRQVADPLALQLDLALARVQQPGDRLQRGALARPVRADQADDLPLPDLQGNPFQRVDVAVIGVDVVEFQQRHGILRMK